MNPVLAPARLEDIPALQSLIACSARELSRGHYTPAQVEAALGSAWGVDTQLIRDQTYFVIRAENDLIACGGWSKRQALFGADPLTAAEPELLDARGDAARIRAFFVHPAWARRGLGSLLLEKCESAALQASFTTAELVATLPGEPLYAARGYSVVESIHHRLPNGLTIEFKRMRKTLLPSPR